MCRELEQERSKVLTRSTAGNYHFHRGPLAGQTFSSKSAALAALRKHNAGPTKSPTAAKSPAAIIKRASTSKKIDALIALLLKKGLVKEAGLAAEIGRE
jgi:hypothetical protein